MLGVWWRVGILLFMSFMVFLAIVANLALLENKNDSIDGALREAIRTVSSSGVKRVIGGLNQEALAELNQQDPSPIFWLTEMPEDVSQPASTIVTIVFQTFDHFDGDGSYQFHPLTSAYHNGRLNVAKRLLLRKPMDKAKPATREVYASLLSCKAISRIDPSVVLVVHDDETRPCALKHEPRVNYVDSALRLVYEDRHEGRPQGHPPRRRPPPRRLGYYPNSLRDELVWKNPFKDPPPGLYPPPGNLVINPSIFRDFTEAVWFYAFGAPWSEAQWMLFLLFLSLSAMVTVVLISTALRAAT